MQLGAATSSAGLTEEEVALKESLDRAARMEQWLNGEDPYPDVQSMQKERSPSPPLPEPYNPNQPQVGQLFSSIGFLDSTCRLIEVPPDGTFEMCKPSK